jgi:flagellar basal-body rod protein FlgG
MGVLFSAWRQALIRMPRWPTGRPTDIAIMGEGFFQVRQSDDTSERLLFTRRGNLWIDEYCTLRTGMPEEGLYLEPPISIPSGHRFVVSNDGSVLYGTTAETSDSYCCAGQIPVAIFPRPKMLHAISPGLFESSNESGIPDVVNPGTFRAGTILTGWLEASDRQCRRTRVPTISADTVVLLIAIASLTAFFLGANLSRRKLGNSSAEWFSGK